MANCATPPSTREKPATGPRAFRERRGRSHIFRAYLRSALILCLVLSSGAAKDRSKWANPMVFIMLGPPGSGKATQSQILSKKYGIPTITAALVLKKDLDKKTKTSGLQGSVESRATGP
jgi:Holliday junction resolvasome RuvABC ATP-dependent DNA helicase subunit